MNREESHSKGKSRSVVQAIVEDQPQGPAKYPLIVGLLFASLGIASLAMLSFWAVHFLGGVQVTGNPSHPWIFNWHPILVGLALFLFFLNGAQTFRVLEYATNACSHDTAKAIHSLLNTLALIAMSVAVYLVWKFHDVNKIDHFYSVHSWTGLFFISIFSLNWIFGFAVFGLPCAPPEFRKAAIPFHKALGRACFFLSIAVVASGLNQKQSFAKEHSLLVFKYANYILVVVLVTALVGAFAFSHDPVPRAETTIRFMNSDDENDDLEKPLIH